MLQLAESKFKEASGLLHNTVHFRLDEDLLDGQTQLDVEEIISKKDSKDGLIYGCIANNECLPFRDGSFDCYLAPLSLHVVNDYKKQLSEAFRVTKSGAKSGFSVWGRRENIQIYPLVEEIMEKHGLGPQVKPVKTNYDLALKRDELKKEMEDMGFVSVKMWFQPVNFVFNDFTDFFQTLFGQPTTAAKLESLDQEKRDKLIEDAKELYKERIENDTEPKHFENMIIIATKP